MIEVTGLTKRYGQFTGVVWWLGERFEPFDLSQEMPR